MISHPAAITRARASWMALALLLWADCTKAPRDTPSDRASTGGSALDSAALRDLEMANRPERSLPELHDVPVPRPPSSPRGARSAPPERGPTAQAAAALPRDTATPFPAAAPAAPAVNASAPVAPARDTAGTVPGVAAGHVSAGTVIVLRPHVSVCTRFNAVGDLFVSTLTTPIVGAGGVTIPAGVIVSVQITAVARSPGGGAVLNFAVRSFGRLQDGSVPELTPELADITAPVGRLAGHATTEATLLGTCVPRDGELRLTLTQPVRILNRG
jgi:hypothetical protein